jgi:hypothetical protein
MCLNNDKRRCFDIFQKKEKIFLHGWRHLANEGDLAHTKAQNAFSKRPVAAIS